MKYGDLIESTRIGGKVRIQDADTFLNAERLVSTYLVSDDLAREVVGQTFAHMQLDESECGNAVIVGGGHGAGKSHLMAVVSAIAERGHLAHALTGPGVGAAATDFAGRYKSVRVELAATTAPLSTILCAAVQERLGTPGANGTAETAHVGQAGTDALARMVEAFRVGHPDHGVLLVVDELWDYLQTRTEPELASDLACLSEIAELCRRSRLRFIAGLREKLPDDGVSQRISGSLALFQQRFALALIDREHVKQIISIGMVRKDTDQAQRVKAHLLRFSERYPRMVERIDEFVRLFPLHPDYVDTVEPFAAAGGSGVLAFLSDAVQRRLQHEVPHDSPGLISYDDYWATLRDDPSVRALPDVKVAIACGQALEPCIERCFPRADRRQMALQLARALLVRRVAANGIAGADGATAQELCDTLCLPDPQPKDGNGHRPGQLAEKIEALLHEIRDALEGRFLCLDTANQRFCLDPRRVEDYDRLVEEHAAAATPSDLNRYYSELVRRLMAFPEAGLVAGHPVWRHELEWCRGGELAFAKGYAFCGRPGERPPAIGDHQYCIYFVPPHGPQRFERDGRRDEVFVRLSGADEAFWHLLRVWGAALDLLSNSDGHARSIYQTKATDLVRELTNWFDAHGQTALEIEYDGEATSLMERLNHLWGSSSLWEYVSTHDAVNTAAGVCLSQYFRDEALRG